MSTLTLSLIGVFVALLVWGVVLVVARERAASRRHQAQMARLCYLHERIHNAQEMGREDIVTPFHTVAENHWRNILSDNY